jgi:dipeptide/tripeptide permease
VLRVRLEVTLATHPIHINEADKMDGDIGGMIFEPEQMQMLNALFVLILIPIFDKGLYPLVALLVSC